MEDAVSNFIIDSCANVKPPNEVKYRGMLCKYDRTVFNKAAFIIKPPLRSPSGSSNEFFIQPLIPYIGDVDILLSSDQMLAMTSIPRQNNHMQLPEEFLDSKKN